MTTSSKSLFRAVKAKPKGGGGQGALMDEMPEARRPARPEDARRNDDFYSTGQPEALRLAPWQATLWSTCYSLENLK